MQGGRSLLLLVLGILCVRWSVLRGLGALGGDGPLGELHTHTGGAGLDRVERGIAVVTVLIVLSSLKETIAVRFVFGAASREEIRGEAADEAFKLLEEKLKEA